ncbi:exported hypothetical protein [Candidatus Sulfopaludibacter sp. SbA3]|nr:exported hypothetical protein [Candidatus Sulfopaludibacter sp. SbA3]
MTFTKQCFLLLAGAGAMLAQQRFDNTVRDDFFAGFRGDRDALERAMKKCEAVLAANPKDPEAMVWHGAGLFFQSGAAAQHGDFPRSAELYQRGLDQMAGAIALAPDRVGVLIPRAATLLDGSHFIPGENGKALIKIALEDYEKTYRLQASYFATLDGHSRSELLFGLAEGYLRLSDTAKAREWFQKLAAVNDPENGHLKQAQAYLETGSLTGGFHCAGCHVDK